jgi:hypothetical protein
MCITPWLFAGWSRIPRYTRFYQQENFDAERYSLFLTGHKGEERYCLLYFLALAIFPVVFCGAFCYLPLALSRMVFDTPYPLVLINFVFVLLAVLLTPRDHQRSADSKLTGHATRLLITAFFVELIPTLIELGIIWISNFGLSDPKNSPESMILAPGFVGVMLLTAVVVGPVTFFLIPQALPVASAINWPIDFMLSRANRQVTDG